MYFWSLGKLWGDTVGLGQNPDPVFLVKNLAPICHQSPEFQGSVSVVMYFMLDNTATLVLCVPSRRVFITLKPKRKKKASHQERIEGN